MSFGASAQARIPGATAAASVAAGSQVHMGQLREGPRPRVERALLWPGIVSPTPTGRLCLAPAIALSALALASGCVAFGGAAPPSRTDVARTVHGRAGELRHGTHLAVGTHWASGTLSRDVPIDVGAGVIFERDDAEPDRGEASLALVTAPQPMAESTGPWRRGYYVDVAYALGRRGYERAWLGSRFEALHALRASMASRPAVGASVRFAWELFATGAGAAADSNNKAFVVAGARGTSAVGLFLETGVRVDAESATSYVARGGVTVRLPLLAFFGVAVR